MADFPSTIPPSIPEHIEYIRWWLGNITESTITDADMTVIIAMNIGKYGEDNCKIVYYSTVDILRWLIREQAKGQSGSSGGAGTYQKRIEEHIGKRKKVLEYGIDTSGATASVATGWDRVLEDLLSNPSTIGCNPIDATSSGSSGSVIIGVQSDKYNFNTPYRQNLNRDYNPSNRKY